MVAAAILASIVARTIDQSKRLEAVAGGWFVLLLFAELLLVSTVFRNDSAKYLIWRQAYGLASGVTFLLVASIAFGLGRSRGASSRRPVDTIGLLRLIVGLAGCLAVAWVFAFLRARATADVVFRVARVGESLFLVGAPTLLVVSFAERVISRMRRQTG
jgi:hypothetical protein